MIKIITHDKITEWCYASDNPVLRLVSKPYWTSCYLIDGLLIDAGAPASVPDLRSFLKSLGPEDFPEQCVITHWHEDHCGGAKMLSEELGMPVFANEISIEKMYPGFTYSFYRAWAWGKKVERTTDVMPIPELPFSTRSRKYTFDIMKLEGHTDGLIVLFEKTQGWAFLSDAIVPKYVLLFNSKDFKEDIYFIYLSIKKVMAYFKQVKKPVTLFISGHGRFDNGMEFLEKKLSELELLHETAHRLKNEGLSESGIVKKMLGRESFVSLLTGNDLSKINLVRSLLEWEKE